MTSRRSLLIGGGVTLLLPRQVWAQAQAEREHQVHLELPILSEEPAAVPIKVGVGHPMEPDHFIKSIEVVVEKDPVPYKGRFLFTPANGQAWVAFQMRSGAGGTVTAVAECSKHGRFVGTRALRVVEGGCTTAPEKKGRDHLGNPMLRLPRSIRAGDVVEVRAKVDHNSHTGLSSKDGKFVREAPEFYVKQVLVFLDDQKVSEFQMTSAVSPNPLIRFPVKVARGGTLKVIFVNSEDLRWEVSQRVQL